MFVFVHCIYCVRYPIYAKIVRELQIQIDGNHNPGGIYTILMKRICGDEKALRRMRQRHTINLFWRISLCVDSSYGWTHGRKVKYNLGEEVGWKNMKTKWEKEKL